MNDSSIQAGIPMSRGLSDLQSSILRYVVRRYRHIEAQGNDFYRRETSYWGVPWRPFGDDSPDGSERAAMSRALRRLESRGLVERRNQCTGDRYSEPLSGCRPPITRTTHVKLTELGRRMADRLTIGAETFVNRKAAEFLDSGGLRI